MRQGICAKNYENKMAKSQTGAQTRKGRRAFGVEPRGERTAGAGVVVEVYGNIVGFAHQSEDYHPQPLLTEAVHLLHSKTNAQGLAKLHVFSCHLRKEGRNFLSFDYR